VARNNQRPITAEELEQIKSVIIYDPETGYLHSVKNGKRRGSLHPSGYRYVSIIGRNIYEHRLAWALYYNEDPYPLEIDHINRNRSDNIIINLRKVTPAEQNRNKNKTRAPITNTARQRMREAALARWANTPFEQRQEHMRRARAKRYW